MRGILSVGLTLAGVLAASVPGMAATAASPRDGFIKSCVSQMYYSQQVCGCMADKAATAIGQEGIAYLSLQALDVTHSTEMSKQMSGAERNKIDLFMKTAPRQCGAQ